MYFHSTCYRLTENESLLTDNTQQKESQQAHPIRFRLFEVKKPLSVILHRNRFTGAHFSKNAVEQKTKMQHRSTKNFSFYFVLFSGGKRSEKGDDDDVCGSGGKCLQQV